MANKGFLFVGISLLSLFGFWGVGPSDFLFNQSVRTKEYLYNMLKSPFLPLKLAF